jgi:hypothetical protein
MIKSNEVARASVSTSVKETGANNEMTPTLRAQPPKKTVETMRRPSRLVITSKARDVVVARYGGPCGETDDC